jgi:hypothetical protein
MKGILMGNYPDDEIILLLKNLGKAAMTPGL